MTFRVPSRQELGDTTIAVHLCRRAGGKARGEHSFDGSISRIIHHINVTPTPLQRGRSAECSAVNKC